MIHHRMTHKHVRTCSSVAGITPQNFYWIGDKPA